MKNRNVEFFNLSFLDLLSGALAAIIFLFIIVPKGTVSLTEHSPLLVSYDTLEKRFFGEIPDTLLGMQPGDTLLAIIYDFETAPQVARTATPTPKPTPKPTPRKTPEKKETPKAKDEAPKVTVTPSKFSGSKPDVPCVLSIEMKWDHKRDNVDLFVCKDNDCVFGGRKQRAFIGFWDSGKSRTGLFGSDLRTNQEAVRQFDEIIPGEYAIYGQYKEADNPVPDLPVRLQVYTKNEDGVERGKEHYFTLNVNPTERTLIAKITVREDGEFEFQTFK